MRNDIQNKMVLSHQVYQTLKQLDQTQLKKLNREFGLLSTGNRAILITRLMIGPNQIGGARLNVPDEKLRSELGLGAETDETTELWAQRLPARMRGYNPDDYPIDALEAYLLSYLEDSGPENISGDFPESLTIEDIKANLAENELNLKLDYKPYEWYQILMAHTSGKRPPFEALPAYARRFAKNQMSQLSYSQLKDLDKFYPGYFTEALEIATKKLESLRTWLRGLPVGHFWSDIESLSNTKFLMLQEQGIINIPPEIGQLTNLKHLFLYNNNIQQVPPEIGQLTNLETLNLVNNRLSSFPDNLDLPKLTELDLTANRLSSFPENLNLPNLEKLHLGRNPLKSFPKNLKLPKLKLVDIFSTHLTYDEINELNKIYSVESDLDMWNRKERERRAREYRESIRKRLEKKPVPAYLAPL